MSEKKYNCEIVQDLLPLYQDDVCSPSSREMVEQHLKECDTCKNMVAKLMNYDIDDKLVYEKNQVLRTHEKKERKKAFTVGIVTAAILLVPVIVCLICNLAIGHTLDWFFIVLTSLCVVASLIVVPLVVEERKGAWTIGSFTVSLLMLLLTTCIYTRGDWFFVAVSGCMLGLSIVFAPYMVSQIPLPVALSNKKGLLVMLWDTVWLYALIVICGIFVDGGKVYWGLGMATTTYCMVFVWLVFLVARYVKKNAYTKAGVIVAVSGVFVAFANDVVGVLSGVKSESSSIFYADLRIGFKTADLEVLNANIFATILIVSMIVGIAFILIGNSYDRKKKHIEDEACKREEEKK